MWLDWFVKFVKYTQKILSLASAHVCVCTFGWTVVTDEKKKLISMHVASEESKSVYLIMRIWMIHVCTEVSVYSFMQIWAKGQKMCSFLCYIHFHGVNQNQQFLYNFQIFVCATSQMVISCNLSKTFTNMILECLFVLRTVLIVWQYIISASVLSWKEVIHSVLMKIIIFVFDDHQDAVVWVTSWDVCFFFLQVIKNFCCQTNINSDTTNYKSIHGKSCWSPGIYILHVIVRGLHSCNYVDLSNSE